MKPADRLIVALDLDRLAEAEALVKRLIPLGVSRFKVGLNLYTREGPAAVEMVHRRGGRVFLDLKFHDIPNTVGKAMQAAARLGVWMTNVHIQGGGSMMRKALAAAHEEAGRAGRKPPLVIGVTVLTSMAEKELMDFGIRRTLKDQVLTLAKLAKTTGLNGVVASAQEAKVLRLAFGDDFLIVTPGIRPAGGDDLLSVAAAKKKDDQQRTATPAEAVRAGADYLVVGRPILEASDPARVVEEFVEECAGAMRG